MDWARKKHQNIVIANTPVSNKTAKTKNTHFQILYIAPLHLKTYVTIQ